MSGFGGGLQERSLLEHTKLMEELCQQFVLYRHWFSSDYAEGVG